MELRMYGLVNYQLTGIQMGIQFGHAVVEYGLDNNSDLYQDWAKNHKTFIILNGGTTNINPNKLGTLNQHLLSLKDNGIICSPFYEPDLGDQLTAICFIVDERVFNKEKYPDFNFTQVEFPFSQWTKQFGTEGDELNRILFLRDFLKNFRLA